MNNPALLKFFFTHGIKEEKCETCHIEGRWQGLPINFQPFFLNGDKQDRCPENIKILCPDCLARAKNSQKKRTTS